MHGYSKYAAEAESQTVMTEQQGKGGSLIKNLNLFKRKFSKPASLSLAKDGAIQQRDGDKLSQ